MSPVAPRQYELIYIVTPDASDQDVAGVHAEVESIVARFNGQIENTEHWGKRRLAYVIGDHKEGTYVLELIRGSGDLVKELDRRLRVSDHVLRHLVVRVDEESRVAERRTADRKEWRERRRSRRGLTGDGQASEPSLADESAQQAAEAAKESS